MMYRSVKSIELLHVYFVFSFSYCSADSVVTDMSNPPLPLYIQIMCSNLGDKYIMAELNPMDWKCDNPQVRF